jgi:hypothetical protein
MSNLSDEKYKTFDDLPQRVKDAVIELQPVDIYEYVTMKIPAAGNRTVLEILNKEGEAGEIYIIQMISRCLSK